MKANCKIFTYDPDSAVGADAVDGPDFQRIYAQLGLAKLAANTGNRERIRLSSQEYFRVPDAEYRFWKTVLPVAINWSDCADEMPPAVTAVLKATQKKRPFGKMVFMTNRRKSEWMIMGSINAGNGPTWFKVAQWTWGDKKLTRQPKFPAVATALRSPVGVFVRFVLAAAAVVYLTVDHLDSWWLYIMAGAIATAIVLYGKKSFKNIPQEDPADGEENANKDLLAMATTFIMIALLGGGFVFALNRDHQEVLDICGSSTDYSSLGSNQQTILSTPKGDFVLKDNAPIQYSQPDVSVDPYASSDPGIPYGYPSQDYAYSGDLEGSRIVATWHGFHFLDWDPRVVRATVVGEASCNSYSG